MTERYDSLRAALNSCAGESTEIRRLIPVSGGDINDSYCLILSNGRKLFMKANHTADSAFFRTEAVGLEVIAGTGTIKVPEVFVYGHEASHGNFEFLLMEYLESPGRVSDYWESFGRNLAALHAADTADIIDSGKFGFSSDNYIGRNRQVNTPCGSWIRFFRDFRILPQAKMAKKYFSDRLRKQLYHLLDHLEEYLVEPESPSLLHGDLWSGNAMPGNDGEAWLIDPAAYVGHAEADLAMTELFGGFPRSFYRAYEEMHPLQPGYRDRRDIYNLYHLLNHTNLFGRGYFSAVEEILGRF